MDFKKSRKIRNCTAHYFSLENGDIVFLSLEKEIIRKGSVEWSYKSEQALYPEVILDNCLFVQQRIHNTIKEQTICIDLLNGKEIADFFPKHFLSLGVDKNKKVMLVRNTDSPTREFLLIGTNKFERKWPEAVSGKSAHLLYDGVIIIDNKNINKLQFYSSEGIGLWNFDISSLDSWYDYENRLQKIKLSKIIGVLNGLLYIYLNSGKVLTLDLKTGENVKILSNDKLTNSGSFNGNFDFSIELDHKTGKLIQLFRQDYTEVDLNTLEVTHIQIEDMNNLNLENTSGFVFDDQCIYFTDKYHNQLAILDRLTHKIVWNHTFEDAAGPQSHFARSLKIADNKLYALDNKNTLHVFEM